MTLITLYAVTLVVFLAIDALMLAFVMKPLFARHIGHLMAEPIRMTPAVAFYAAYVAGVIYLVSWPALTQGAPLLLPAAVIGFLAYGTYEFTSYAVMRDWHWSMVLTDTAWGTVLTAASAWAGVTAVRALGLTG
jgi:uncharacterized membrane protein